MYITVQREGPQERRWTPPRLLRNRPPPQTPPEVRMLTERGPPPAEGPQAHRSVGSVLYCHLDINLQLNLYLRFTH